MGMPNKMQHLMVTEGTLVLAMESSWKGVTLEKERGSCIVFPKSKLGHSHLNSQALTTLTGNES